MSSEQSPVNAKSHLIDGIVIIVSILIAFGLDAWWDGHSARKVEQAHLAALRVDFEQTREHLQEAIEHETRSVALARQLTAGAGIAPVVEGMLDSMMYELFSMPTFEPVQGAYHELLSSGELALIRDKPLRKALASWESRIDNYKTREKWLYDIWNLFIAPYLMQEISMMQIMPDSLLKDRPPNPFPRDHAVALNDRYFHNIVVHRWVAAADVLKSLGELRQANEQILEQLTAGDND